MKIKTLTTIGLAVVTAALMKLSVLGVIVPPNSLTLAWDASLDTSVAGYRIYQGSTSGNYTNAVDAGAVTQKTFSGLATGNTYFFTVVSYTLNGLESVPSNEISYTAGTGFAPTLKLSLQPNRQVVVHATGPAGYRYDVLATQRFTNWTVIGTLTNGSNGSGQFTDTAAPNYSSRSYRLRQTAP